MGRWHDKCNTSWSYQKSGYGTIRGGGKYDNYIPQVGDFVAIDNNGKIADGPDHTGIVYSVVGNTLTTIEGNISKKVVKVAWLTFAEVLGLPKVGFWNVVIIVVFMTVGFNFLFPHKHRSHGDQDDPHARRSDYTKYQKVTEEEGDGFVECSNSFGETTKYVNMSDLKRGHFQNSFGEMKVYLDQAHMAGDSVTIEVSNSFGQLTLFIPKEWNVVQKVSVFAASVDEKRCGDSNGPICYLKGSVSFGEIEIVYV